jgi:hypothetical protein
LAVAEVDGGAAARLKVGVLVEENRDAGGPAGANFALRSERRKPVVRLAILGTNPEGVAMVVHRNPVERLEQREHVLGFVRTESSGVRRPSLAPVRRVTPAVVQVP